MSSTTMRASGRFAPGSRLARALNIGLWVLQVVLAGLFLLHGWLFLAPPADMVAAMNASIPPALRLFIGAAELLAAAGLILPGATRVFPGLTVLAAAGLMVVMTSATTLHLFRGERSVALTTVTLLVLVTLVAWLRWRVVPIAARGATTRE
jgi:putative oxidoreductase